MLVVFRAEMPPFASQLFEFCVVLLLVGFGVRAIYQGARGRPAGRAQRALHHEALGEENAPNLPRCKPTLMRDWRTPRQSRAA
jgi:hypothetical protein